MGKLKLRKITPNEAKHVESFFRCYHSFITEITNNFPNRTFNRENDDVSMAAQKSKTLPLRLCPAKASEKKPARTVEELQAKLSSLRGKPTLLYKEKLQKKGLKTRLKKKEKKEKRKLKRTESKARGRLLVQKTQIAEFDTERKALTKPVYNTEGDMVFSKFDFSEFGAKAEKVGGHVVKDPAVALRKIKEEEEKLKILEEKGHNEQVKAFKERKLWKTAILRTEGITVKDDPDLLKASIKKLKKKKEKSALRWKANEKRILKEKEEKQRKRTENMEVRSRAKKLKKLKIQAKRGRIIAGF